jgi:tRNA/rRNA methyltransferase
MNLGQSVAVCLYELARNIEVASSADEEAHTTSGETERITKSLLDVLHASGFIRYGSEHTAEEKSRRFVRRMNLQAADAKVMLGMLRRILWKLKSKK